MSSKGISIEAKRIKVVKDWLDPKSVHNIQIFLGFTNFYRQFLQSFNKIVASFTLMLKIIGLPDKPIFNKNNDSRLASNRNDNNKSVFRKNNGNSEVDRFDISGNGVRHIKKSGKLSKLRKSKSKKMSKSQNLAKSKKKLLKNGNLTNFNATEAGPKFLTSNARTIFNCLQLIFTEIPIL